MSKRFTDTDKWKDPWYCSLSCVEKLFWQFLLDNCSVSGIWQVNWPLVSFYIPDFKFNQETFKDRIQPINDQKWFIPKFITFQYGRLQETNRFHQRIIFDLKKEGVSIPLKYPLEGVQDKEEDKDKEEEGGSGGKQNGPTPQDLIDLWNGTANQILPRVKGTTAKRVVHIKKRLQEHPDPDYWEGIIAKINKSPLLLGQNGSWKCTFDWILNENNLTKIEEGNYDPAKTY